MENALVTALREVPAETLAEAVKTATGIDTAAATKETCIVCSHKDRYIFEYLYISMSFTTTEIASFAGVHRASIYNHCGHVGLVSWRQGRGGIRTMLREIAKAGLANKDRAKPADAIAALKLDAQLQGLLDTEESGGVASLLKALHSEGGVHQSIIERDLARAEEVEVVEDGEDGSPTPDSTFSPEPDGGAETKPLYNPDDESPESDEPPDHW